VSITCNDVYKLAMALLGEDADAADTADMASRAPALITIAISSLWDLDRAYRIVNFNTDSGDTPPLISSLAAAFPLSDRFSSLCAYYTAAKLTGDENPSYADKLIGFYTNGAVAAANDISAITGSISDFYGGIG